MAVTTGMEHGNVRRGEGENDFTGMDEHKQMIHLYNGRFAVVAITTTGLADWPMC
jgi:hypothetical protein